MAPAERRRLVALLALGLALRLAVAWAPFDPWHVHHGPLVDDSFYYFQIARNIAGGAGMTHDGAALTSGFQPLWAFLLVPIWRLAGGDPLRPIQLALTLSAALGALTGWGLWRLVRRLAGGAGALYAAALWCLSPYVVEHTMNGMETGLAACLLVWTAHHYVSRVRPGGAAWSAWAWLGVLGGGCYLARADAAIFLAALGADALWRLGPRRSLGGGALAAGLALLMAAPWIAWCVALGSPLPESAAATRQLSALYATIGAYSDHPFASAGFYLDNATALARHLLAQPLAPLPALPVGYALHWGLRGAPLATWLTLAVYAALAALVWRGPLRWALPAGRFPGFLWAWAGLTLAAYAVVAPAQWFYDRYTFGVCTLGLALAGVVVQSVTERLGRRAAAAYLAVSLLGVGAVFARQADVLLMRQGPMNIAPHVALARALSDNPRLLEPVGVMQSGVVGYLSGVAILALDGKVNGDAARALRDRRLFTYLRGRGARFIVDAYPGTTDLLVREGSVGEPRPALRPVPIYDGDQELTRGYFLVWPSDAL